MSAKKKFSGKALAAFVTVTAGLLVLFFLSINLGSIRLTVPQLLRGLFVEYDQDVASVYDLRFPRILIAMMGGASLAVAGALFQAVLKNPLADPGLLGISSGAGFAAALSTMLFPSLFFMTPLFSFLGGMLVFFLIYSMAWKGTLSPLRIILLGIAMQSLFTGLSQALGSMSMGSVSSVASIVDGNITMKTWKDVHLMALVAGVGLVPALFSAKWCNLCGLEDRTVRGLGVDVDRVRLLVSIVAVFLVGGCTAILGPVSFIGLLVPHIGRIFVGSDHRKLLPFSALAGALLMLTADTLGRTIIRPHEMNASVILAVVGGIAFVLLLRKSGGIYGK